MTILYALLVLLVAILVTTITSLYMTFLYSYTLSISHMSQPQSWLLWHYFGGICGADIIHND